MDHYLTKSRAHLAPEAVVKRKGAATIWYTSWKKYMFLFEFWRADYWVTGAQFKSDWAHPFFFIVDH